LSHISSPFFSAYFGDDGHTNYFPSLALNHNLPNISLSNTSIIGMSNWHLAHLNILISIFRTFIGLKLYFCALKKVSLYILNLSQII
jgi:hypothetical protein